MAVISLDLTRSEKAALRKAVGPIKTTADFIKDFADSIAKLPIPDAVKKAVPWAIDSSSVGAGFLPLAKVVLKVLDKLGKEHDPHTLGVIACTLAYQRSAALALELVGSPSQAVPLANPLHAARGLKFIDESQIPDRLDGFSLDLPLAHTFIWRADRALRTALLAVGYTEEECRRVQQHLHDEFRSNLTEVLSSGETAEHLQPFRVLLAQGEDASARIAINAHVERQRIQYHERPVLSKEPFALRDVYVETNCADLTWRDHLEAKRKGLPFDPFSDERSRTPDLLGSVIRRFKDPAFNDAVVLQGPAGAGKSAFTLRLCDALINDGLRPLRIRLRYLDLSDRIPLLDAIARVVLRPDEDEDPMLSDLPACRDPFRGGRIFEERTTYGQAEICPYVLILDGWDEISLTSSEGFRIEIARLLDRIRTEFLMFRRPLVRVLLTGRPSDAIEESRFLREDTPILTARPYSSAQLLEYVDNVSRAVRSPRFADREPWPAADWSRIRESLADERLSKLDVLQSPLLAHLALWLLVQKGADPDALLEDTIALYRNLVDLTCAKAGKAELVNEDLYRQERVSGIELRELLHKTAIAITVHGQENISFQELELRLNLEEGALEGAVQSAARNRLTALMISFYFKGGQFHLGCEFLHKSFREYLFAEAVVEIVKRYAHRQHGRMFAVRQPYWKDFEEHATDDVRHEFSRELSSAVSGQILGTEIRLHLERLIACEIQRATKQSGRTSFGTSTQTLAPGEWQTGRDLLADLWDWWAEGVHLRPQPDRAGPGRTWSFRAPYVDTLLDYALPQDRDRIAKQPLTRRTVNIDANLGDTLFAILVFLHWCLMDAAGFSGWDAYKRTNDVAIRPAQSAWQRKDEPPVVCFRPAGGSYLSAYASRINADGWHYFPQGACFRGVDLSDVRVVGLIFFKADLRAANLADANLLFVVLDFARLTGAKVTGAIFEKVESRGIVIPELEGAKEVHYYVEKSHDELLRKVQGRERRTGIPAPIPEGDGT